MTATVMAHHYSKLPFFTQFFVGKFLKILYLFDSSGSVYLMGGVMLTDKTEHLRHKIRRVDKRKRRGAGIRTYDAENKMLTAKDITGQTSRYTYDAHGNRVRRQVASGQEEWQIYGMEGELLAEYQASSPASAPQKESGYRNGQLLISATGRLNVALAANGAVATASSTAFAACL